MSIKAKGGIAKASQFPDPESLVSSRPYPQECQYRNKKQKVKKTSRKILNSKRRPAASVEYLDLCPIAR